MPHRWRKMITNDEAWNVCIICVWKWPLCVPASHWFHPRQLLKINSPHPLNYYLRPFFCNGFITSVKLYMIGFFPSCRITLVKTFHHKCADTPLFSANFCLKSALIDAISLNISDLFNIGNCRLLSSKRSRCRAMRRWMCIEKKRENFLSAIISAKPAWFAITSQTENCSPTCTIYKFQQMLI